MRQLYWSRCGMIKWRSHLCRMGIFWLSFTKKYTMQSCKINAEPPLSNGHFLTLLHRKIYYAIMQNKYVIYTIRWMVVIFVCLLLYILIFLNNNSNSVTNTINHYILPWMLFCSCVMFSKNINYVCWKYWSYSRLAKFVILVIFVLGQAHISCNYLLLFFLQFCVVGPGPI